MRILVVKDDTVVNAIVVENADGFTPPEGCVLMQVPGAEIGWKLSGDTLVPPPPPPAPKPAPEQIKAECQRRVYAVASQNCQMNMTAYVAAGEASDAEKSTFKDALTWVQATRAACLALVELDDPTYADDAHWPACPAAVSAFAARF